MTPTPSAEVMNELIAWYNYHRIEVCVGSRYVNCVYTNQPRLKHYYRERVCSEVMSFYEYCFPQEELEFV
jgi:hypothetical protein